MVVCASKYQLIINCKQVAEYWPEHNVHKHTWTSVNKIGFWLNWMICLNLNKAKMSDHQVSNLFYKNPHAKYVHCASATYEYMVYVFLYSIIWNRYFVIQIAFVQISMDVVINTYGAN
jgi:hypothetical protein